MTPFQVNTSWQVITGAPCCGKTTLINQLADRGYRTAPEIARQYFERELARGRRIDEIRSDPVAAERVIEDLQLRLERGLRATEVVFLDRALPDSLSFRRVAGLDLNEILAECFRHRNAAVFLLDRFPVQQDGPRTEDDTTAALLDEWLGRHYSALGYNVVRVPALPPQERLTFVLERLSEQGLVARLNR